jgi:manganese transport protein
MAETGTSTRRWYQRLGPGLITACVVIGPGSILTSSKVGAANGYSMSWVVVVAVLFMMVYISLGAKLGVVATESTGKLITDRVGRWLAVSIGLSVFFISAAFQFGNNLGVHSAFQVYAADFDITIRFGATHIRFMEYGIVVFNAVTIAFLFGFKNLYRAVERLMMTFVGLMLVSFAINLFFAKPNLRELAQGFIPSKGDVGIEVLGLVGTTFVITAAFFQTYLARQKGWTRENLKDSQLDARVGAMLMALITLMLMTTAAAVLRGQELGGVRDVAVSLQPLFGDAGQALFCMGLFAAAYSSFLVNSMIGGFILSDGLGFGSKPTDIGPKVFTTVVLLTGMGVALYVIKQGTAPVAAIVAAQAVTVVASPLMAGALLWMTNREDIMGKDKNGPLINVLAGAGFLLLLGMAWYTATEKVLPAVTNWMNSSG